MASNKILESLRRLRAESMPSSRQVVQETCQRLGYTSSNLSQDYVRHNFNNLLRRLFEETLFVLEEYERKIDAGVILPRFVELRRQDLANEWKAMTEEGGGESALEGAVIRLLRSWHETLRGLFLSISQSRKQRGGKDFEFQIEFLLSLAGIPFEMQPRRERADFILPSSQVLQKERPRAVILSAKRTLRERWQEVVDELQRIGCPNTYLATAEETLAQSAVNEIKRRNIYLVVWDDLKQGKFKHEPLVASYSKFIDDLTGHFLPQWPMRR